MGLIIPIFNLEVRMLVKSETLKKIVLGVDQEEIMEKEFRLQLVVLDVQAVVPNSVNTTFKNIMKF